jgi:hypothetical protein
MSFAAKTAPLVLCRGHTNDPQLRPTFRRTHLRTTRARYWRVARRAQSLSTTDPSGMDIRQTGSASLGVQYKAPISAVMPSRGPTRLRAYVRKLSVALATLRNTCWPSNTWLDRGADGTFFNLSVGFDVVAIAEERAPHLKGGAGLWVGRSIARSID